ncbi:MAG: 4Fe-4S dicluster domain-containing protein [candidate division WOR-3 bacterium]
MFKIKMREEWCKGCYFCINICPKKVYTYSNEYHPRGFKKVKIDKEENCIGCLLCEELCPDLVITIIKDDKKS